MVLNLFFSELGKLKMHRHQKSEILGFGLISETIELVETDMIFGGVEFKMT